MKKCPTCEKTFEDSMRFCQSDGTPLVDAAEKVDPYKTMVARPEDIASAIPDAPAPPKIEPPIEAPSREEDVLQLPKQEDPLKTMFASEEEIRREMSGGSNQEEQVIEIPPLTEAAAPEPPSFTPEPVSSPTPPPPSPFGSAEPPPSPFAAPEPASPKPADRDLSPVGEDRGIGNMTTPPIPSPFGEDRPPRREATPEPPPFRQPEPPPPASVNPFNEPTVPAPNWTPPPPPAPQKTSPPVVQGGQGMAPARPSAGAGKNQTLAIVSLVLGVLSIILCQITGPVAVVLGFMARGKANKNPAQYTGSGLALGGIITGLIGTLLLFLVVAYVIFVFGYAATQGF